MRRAEQLVVAAEAHHVEQQLRVADERDSVLARDAEVAPVVQPQRPAAVEAGAGHGLLEPANARVARFERAVEAVQQQHLVAQRAEAEQVLEELPDVSRAAGLLRHGAGDRDPPGGQTSRHSIPSRSAQTVSSAPCSSG